MCHIVSGLNLYFILEEVFAPCGDQLKSLVSGGVLVPGDVLLRGSLIQSFIDLTKSVNLVMPKACSLFFRTFGKYL